MTMFHSLADIERYLQSYIPNAALVRFPGEEGILRTKEFLKLLGSPQNTIPCIHVAGTSGKGSTSFMISTFLHSQGFSVGLHLSPHLMDIRERSMINNTLINEKKYISYFQEIVPAIEKMKSSAYGSITYFEVMVGFIYYVFARESVDYMVVEVGLGGLYDGTNVIDRQDKLSVITKIGFDHVKVLGNTLTDIAHQKAGICVDGGHMITISQFPTAEKAIKTFVREKKAQLHMIRRGDLRRIILTDGKTHFDLRWNEKNYNDITIGLFGKHQAENAALALGALLYLAERDHFEVNMDTLRAAAVLLHFKGRMDTFAYKGKTIILDGAHNEQKMRAFTKALKQLDGNKKYTFLIAFKKGKDYGKMIKLLIPFAHKIGITTIFSSNPDFSHFSTDPLAIKSTLEENAFGNNEIVNGKEDILLFINRSKTDVVITGSLYLLGDVYTLLKQ